MATTSAKKTPARRADPRESAAKKTSAPSGTAESHDHIGAPARRKLLADTGALEPTKAKAEERVTVRIPRGFRLQVFKDDGTGTHTIQYNPGIDEMPRSHAEHDYSVANGVEIVDA